MSQQDPVQAVLACSQCGRSFAHSDLVQIAGSWVCGDCKPAFLSRVMASGAAQPFGWRYGGVWIRFAARFIDGIVLGVPFLVFFAAAMPSLIKNAQQGGSAPNAAFPAAFAVFGLTSFAIYFLIVIGYEVGMLKYRGATLGKMACGLKVVRTDGSDLGWGVSVGRFLMWNVVTSGIPYLNMVLMPVSAIIAGSDAEKRALHDRVCDTRVVFKQSLA